MGSSLYLSGGVQSTSKLTKTFAVANSFAVGDVVRYDISSSSYVKAQADTATNAEVVGVVEDASSGQFTVVYSGEIDLTSVSTLSGFSGPVLFLSNSVAGGLTANPPSTIGSVVKPLVVRNATTNQYVVTNFLGTQIGGSSTVAIDEIQPVGTIMPFAGSVIPESWLECNGNSYAVSAYPQLYAKLQNSSGDRAPVYGYVATLTGTNVSGVLSVGDYIQFKTDTAAFTGTGNPLAGTATNASLLAVVLSTTTTTAVVQVIPTYSNATKNFTTGNTVFTGGGFVGTETGTGNYRAYTSAGAFKAVSLTISTTTVTHFNTPDLRGRFALGVNTSALPSSGDLETDTSNNSAISGIYSLGSEGGQEATVVDTAGVLTGTTNTKFTTTSSSSTGTIANMPPYTVVRYIIKATPYTRAAIIDGLDLPYSNLLVGDLRDGALRPGGAGEDLLFKTNNGSGGTERMRLSNAGRLGIATTSPRAPLDVTTSSVGVQIAHGTPSVYATIGNDSSNNSVYNAWSGHVWQNGGTEKLRLSAAGDLGIGTSAPGYTLDITANGTARIGSALVTSTTTTLGSANVIMNGSGGLAVGTSTAPSAKAEIHGADGTKQGLFVNLGGTDAASTATSLATMWTRAPVHIKMTGTSTARLLLGGLNTGEAGIQSSSANGGGAFNLIMQPYGGLVGIGYPAPSYKLDVLDGGSTVTSALRLTTGGSRSYIHFKDGGTSTQSQIGCAGNDLVMVTGGTERMRITSGGVGVSTIWIPIFQNISFPKNGGADQSAGSEFKGLANAITSPGSASESYTLVVLATSYSYNPGDVLRHEGTFAGVPGGASVIISQGGDLYSINGSTTTAPATGEGNAVGYRSQMLAIWYRTA